MKMFAHIAESNGSTIVYVSKEASASAGFTAGRCNAAKFIHQAACIAADNLVNGQVHGVQPKDLASLQLLGDFNFLTGQIDIGEHPLFLLTKNRSSFYYLANEHRFATVESLEKFLASFGLGVFEWAIVNSANVHSVISQYTSFEKLIPQVVVVLEDGQPVLVQVGGMHSRLKVRVFNILHSDDVASTDDDLKGALKYANGALRDHVVECSPVIEYLDHVADVATFIN